MAASERSNAAGPRRVGLATPRTRARVHRAAGREGRRRRRRRAARRPAGIDRVRRRLARPFRHPPAARPHRAGDRAAGWRRRIGRPSRPGVRSRDARGGTRRGPAAGGTEAGGPPVDVATERVLDAGAGEAGLSAAQVAERRALGQVNDVPATPSRTTKEIVRANVLTRFNALLGSMLVLILIVGPLQDALFGVVIVLNSAIGIFQEVRAKRTLDRLAVLTAPRARVVRDGEVRELAVNEVVLDDILEIGSGSQVVVDGDVIAARGLEMDESLLTGESDAVVKAPGDPVL